MSVNFAPRIIRASARHWNPGSPVEMFHVIETPFQAGVTCFVRFSVPALGSSRDFAVMAPMRAHDADIALRSWFAEHALSIETIDRTHAPIAIIPTEPEGSHP